MSGVKKIIKNATNEKKGSNMLMKSALRNVVETRNARFNIIEEFSDLTPRRKVLMCDHLFTEGRQAFYNTVELLWPQSTAEDAKRLEKFLYSLKNRVN